MKYLLLLSLVLACGKHEMPAQKDLGDADGDLIPNSLEASEKDKFFAAVFQADEIKADLTIEGVGKYSLSNSSDLRGHTKDLMIKRKKSLRKDDYFSEFSNLRIMNPPHGSALIPDGLSTLTLKFSGLKVLKKALYLVGDGEKIKLGDLSPSMSFELSKANIELLVDGYKVLAILDSEKRAQNFYESQGESIRNKSYRIFFDDGINSSIYYASKKLPKQTILRYLNIDSYKDIEVEYLLSLEKRSTTPEWWFREIDENQFVVLKDSSQGLSDHLLQRFKKSTYVLGRVEGSFNNGEVSISAPADSLTLIKVRSKKVMKSYVIQDEVRTVYPSPDNFAVCTVKKRVVQNTSAETSVRADPYFELAIGGIDFSENPFLTSMHEYKDEKGTYWEFRINNTTGNFKLNIPNRAFEFVQEGDLTQNCYGTMTSLASPANLKSSEKLLLFDIEAYVEKEE